VVHQSNGPKTFSDQRFRRSVENLPVLCWLASGDGTLTWFNRSWHNYCGSTPEQMAGEGWQSVHDPKWLPSVLKRWSECLANGQPTEITFPLRGADGRYRTFLTRVEPEHDDTGAIDGWCGVSTDITELHEAQSLLLRNAETFTNLVVSNPFGIYVLDADFKMIEISRGSRAVFASVDALIGRDFAETLRIIWPEPFAAAIEMRFRHTLETGEPYVSPSTSETRADIGQTEVYDWRIERITLPDGRNGVVCYFYDLSHHIAQQAKLTQALADKDLLAREIDHRVKNSLSIVGALLSMQCSAPSTSVETRAALNEAAGRVVAVARVHERLHKSHQLGVIAFGEYIEQICRDLAGSMSHSHVELQCNAIAANIPADVSMPLALIVHELVTNAFKHGSAAGATKINVTLEWVDDALTLCVSDNGAGLVATPTEATASLGFKLVSALARQLNASITIPLPGQPARFVVAIPRAMLQTVQSH
jgi:two-component system, sensor histidine kinase PdtaS